MFGGYGYVRYSLRIYHLDINLYAAWYDTDHICNWRCHHCGSPFFTRFCCENGNLDLTTSCDTSCIKKMYHYFLYLSFHPPISLLKVHSYGYNLTFIFVKCMFIDYMTIKSVSNITNSGGISWKIAPDHWGSVQLVIRTKYYVKNLYFEILNSMSIYVVDIAPLYPPQAENSSLYHRLFLLSVFPIRRVIQTRKFLHSCGDSYHQMVSLIYGLLNLQWHLGWCLIESAKIPSVNQYTYSNTYTPHVH